MERLLFAAACVLVHVPSVLIRYAPFRELLGKKRRIGLFFLYAAVLFMIGVCYYIFGADDSFLTHKLVLLGAAIALSGINVFAIRGYWRQHMFSSGLASLHVSATFYMCAFFTMRMGRVQDERKIVLISAVATFLLFVILSRFYLNTARRVVTPFLDLDCNDYWRRVWFIPMPLFFASYFSCPLDTYYDDVYSLINRVLVLVAAVLICNTIADEHTSMRSRLRLSEQLSAQHEYILHLTEHVNEARKSRHDFKHHLAAIRRYIDTDDKAGLEHYWETLYKHVSTGMEVPCTGNTALDGILYRYSVLAEENDIKLDISGIMEKIVIPDTDFSVLVGNALDNAFSGCMTVESDRRIKVQLDVHRQEQLILISNSYDGLVSVDGDKLYSRRRKNRHGLGIDSMRSVCDKYGATMDVRYDRETFAILMLIKIAE